MKKGLILGLLWLLVVGYVNYKFMTILSITILSLIGGAMWFSIIVAVVFIFISISEWRQERADKKAESEAKQKGDYY